MIFIFFKNLFADLYRQPLRTFLTLSGVVWGTFAIVLLLAFGDSVGKSISKRMHGMGEGLIIAWPTTTVISYKGFIKGKEIRLTVDDVLQVKQRVPRILRISPEFVRDIRIRYNKEEYSNTLRGVSVDYREMRNAIPRKGRFINELDVINRRRVCFLGDTIANNLFGEEDPLGKKVYLEGVPFVVVGVMVRKFQNSNYLGQLDEHCIFVPYTTFSALYGQKYINNMVILPFPGQSIPVIANIREYLGNRIGFSPNDTDALFMWDLTDIEKNLAIFQLAFNIFLGMIGAFTLMVGGVGVASIMLVVVEERIREIGVKLAVGAKRKQILRQFLSEALIIILIGGIIGFAFAALVIGAVPVEKIEEYVGRPQINVMVGIVTILILLAVGSIAGLMPARKAASTNPIEALRSR